MSASPTTRIHEAVLLAINTEAASLKDLHAEFPRGEVVDQLHKDTAAAFAAGSTADLVALWDKGTLCERFSNEHQLPLSETFERLLTHAALGAPGFALEHYNPPSPPKLRLPPVAVPLPVICRDENNFGVVATSLPLFPPEDVQLNAALAEWHGLAGVCIVCVDPAALRKWCARLNWDVLCEPFEGAPVPGPAANGRTQRPLLSLRAFRAPMKEAPWNTLPPRLLTGGTAVPVWCTKHLVTLALPHDSPPALKADLRTLLHGQARHVRFLYAPHADVDAFIGVMRGRALEEGARRVSKQLEVVSSEEETEQIRLEVLEASTTNVLDPAVTIVQTILVEAIRRRASDVQIKETADSLRIRYNINGQWEDVPGGFASASSESVMARLKHLAKLSYVKQMRPLDGSIKVRVDFGKGDKRFYLFRLNAVRDVGDKQRITLRPQDNSKIPVLEELKLTDQALAFWRRNLRRRQGLIVSVGPTGSGKTTTLHACINAVNKPGVNIVTAESPVEREIPGVNQMEVPEFQPEDPTSLNRFTYADALRAMLRQKPNIIMVGELRDSEELNIALNAANTGHLVLSTIHVNSVHEILTRFLSMGANPVLLAQTLRGAVGQRLVRIACPLCSIRTPIEKAHYEEFGIPPELQSLIPLGTPCVLEYNEEGCGECQHGIKGSRAYFEILSAEHPAERSLISRVAIAAYHGRPMPDGAEAPSVVLETRMRELGYQPLSHSLCLAAAAGEISLAEAAQFI